MPQPGERGSMRYEYVVAIFNASLTACSLDNTEAYDIELLLQQVVEVDLSRIANRLRLSSKYALSSSPTAKVRKVLEKVDVDKVMESRILQRTGTHIQQAMNVKTNILWQPDPAI